MTSLQPMLSMTDFTAVTKRLLMASEICLWRIWQKQQIRTLTATRTDERMAKAVSALKASRKASDEAYRQLVKFVNAYALIEGDSKYLSFIDYVNTEIVHYKREVIGQKSGSTQTSGTTGGTTSGGSTGGSTGGTISGGTTPPSVEIEG